VCVTGSTIGRSLLVVPAMLAAAGIGIVIVGMTGAVSVGLLVTLALALAGAFRAARTGVTIDLDRQQVVLRTFWRTHRVDAAELQRVDALSRSTEGTAGVRFLLRDGREYGSLALAYLAVRTADRLIADLRALTEETPFEVDLTTGSFRRVVS
jgi:hypothetical protein